MTLKERVPRGDGWQRLNVELQAQTAISYSVWQARKVRVISAIENAEYPDGAGVGPQWHISVSRNGVRPKEKDVRHALRAFGLRGAEEDNHHPGVARHFWWPLDPAHRVECECKTTEQLVTDPDGYTWSNAKDGPCRGCELASLTRRPCPFHGLAVFETSADEPCPCDSGLPFRACHGGLR